jgi:acetyl-CoA C-acetyltransferase
VIVRPRRTAVGKFGGTLAKIPAPELGAAVIKAAAGSARASRARPDRRGRHGPGADRRRRARTRRARPSIKAGLPDAVPALTINKVCGSGLKAVMLAAQAIQAGDSADRDRRRPGEHERLARTC